MLAKINFIKAESNKKLQEFSSHYQNVCCSGGMLRAWMGTDD